MMWYYKITVRDRGRVDTRQGVLPGNYVTDVQDEIEAMCKRDSLKLMSSEIFTVHHGHTQLVMSSTYGDKEVEKPIKPVTRVTKPNPVPTVQPYEFGTYWQVPTYATWTLKES